MFRLIPCSWVCCEGQAYPCHWTHCLAKGVQAGGEPSPSQRYSGSLAYKNSLVNKHRMCRLRSFPPCFGQLVIPLKVCCAPGRGTCSNLRVGSNTYAIPIGLRGGRPWCWKTKHNNKINGEMPLVPSYLKYLAVTRNIKNKQCYCLVNKLVTGLGVLKYYCVLLVIWL